MLCIKAVFLLHSKVEDSNCFLFVSFMRNLQLLKVEWLATGKWILFYSLSKWSPRFPSSSDYHCSCTDRPTSHRSVLVFAKVFWGPGFKSTKKEQSIDVVTEMLLLRYSWKNALNKQIFERNMSKKQAFQPCVYCYPQALGWFLIVCNVSSPEL